MRLNRYDALFAAGLFALSVYIILLVMSITGGW